MLIAGRALQGIGAAFLVPGQPRDHQRHVRRGRTRPRDRHVVGLQRDHDRDRPGQRRLADRTRQLARGVLSERAARRRSCSRCRCASWTRAAIRRASARIDWTGAALAVLGLGGIVFGLLEWPPLGAGHPLVLGALAVGAASLVLLVVVERRAASPMLPLALFRSRPFTLANILTLLLYAALSVVMFLVPLNLIQVQHYTATAAGAALLPFPLIMFALSRWSGGLVARVGSRTAADGRAGDRRARPRAVRAARHRRLVLDDVLSGGRRAGARHGDHRRAADDDGDGRGRSAARRRGVRRQQRGVASGRPAGDRGVRRRARPDVRRARAAAARSPDAVAGCQGRAAGRAAQDGGRRHRAGDLDPAVRTARGPRGDRRAGSSSRSVW